MDYKYIEQLLERYWIAETTHEEENILRVFFSQKDIPAELEVYRSLFDYEAEEMKTCLLDDNFDVRILALTEEEPQVVVSAQQVTFRQRLAPLFKAAAIVAIILTIGGALQRPWDSSWEAPRMEHDKDYSMVVDSADTAPIQAENIAEMPVDSTKAIPMVATKD